MSGQPDPKPRATPKSDPKPMTRSAMPSRVTPMRRGAPIERSAGPSPGPMSRAARADSLSPRRKTETAEQRAKRLAVANTKRKRKEARQLRCYGPPARRDYVTALPCCACGRHATPEHPSHQAHTETGGMGYKANADTVAPLCADCHRLHTEMGDSNTRFEAALGLPAGHLKRAAAQTEADWQSGGGA